VVISTLTLEAVTAELSATLSEVMGSALSAMTVAVLETVHWTTALLASSRITPFVQSAFEGVLLALNFARFAKCSSPLCCPGCKVHANWRAASAPVS
jgi:hypothetical protein